MQIPERPLGVTAIAALFVLALFLSTLMRTIGPLFGPLALIVNPAIVVIAFAALYLSPAATLGLALPLALEQNVAAAAPPGLLPTSLLPATCVLLIGRGRWFSRRPSHLGLAALGLYAGERLTELALLFGQGRDIGLIGPAEGLLVPGALLHAALGALVERPLVRLLALFSKRTAGEMERRARG